MLTRRKAVGAVLESWRDMSQANETLRLSEERGHTRFILIYILIYILIL
jgi:hypothetical protein